MNSNQSDPADAGYGLRPEAERSVPEADVPQWHVATTTGNRFGPWPLVELQRRAETGHLKGDDLVWRNGWTDWRPARQLPELERCLGPAQASTGGNAPLPPVPAGSGMGGGYAPAAGGGGPAPLGPPDPFGEGDERAARLSDWFGQPDFVRMIGRVSGVLAAFWLLISVVTWFSSGFQWFTGVLIFFALFVGLEVLAIFMERQQTIVMQLEKVERLLRKQGG